jgi:hypothetical protein
VDRRGGTHRDLCCLGSFCPVSKDAPPVPPAIEQAAAKYDPEMAKWFRTPRGYGLAKARFSLAEIESAAIPEINEWNMPIFFHERPARLAIIGRDLGLVQRTKGKSK